MTEIIPFSRSRPPPPPSIVDPSDDSFVISIGGIRSALNLTGPAVIKATPGRLNKLIIINGGTSGAFVVNDCATTDTATAANTIFVLPFGVTPGIVIDLDWPCLIGIVLSAVPDGTPIIAVSYC
ncbi:MAG: hypothetical protein WBG18_25550 [Xanthobacteraceae bacterium]